MNPKNILRTLWSTLIVPVFGNFHWSPPGWLKRIGSWVASAFLWSKKKPLLALLCVAAVAALGVGSFKGYRWWITRPKPHQVTFQVTPPTRTEIEAEEESQRGPKALTITFNESVAPLAMVGKEIDGGVSVQPAISGIWRWRGDRTLSFVPKEDWPIGASYEVRFKPSVFKPGVKLAQKSISFNAPAFEVKVAEAKFYQDPLKSEEKKTVINLAFSYPVNPAELEKRVSLKLAGAKDPLKYSVSYDALKLKAFIQSETLAIPKVDANIEFKLAPGATPMKGGRAFSQELTQMIAVPGLYSFALSDFTPQVVSNDQDEPEQVLMITASSDLDVDELSKALSVWVLPKFPLDHEPIEDEDPYAWTETEVTPEILNKSVKLVPEAIPNEEEHSPVQNYKYRAEVGDRLFIQVKEGLKSFGGYVLPKDVLRIVEVPAYPSELKIMSKGALLALSGEKKVGIQARDLPGIKVEIGRVLPSQIQNLVSQSFGDYDNPEFYGRFRADNIIERFERDIALPNLKRGQSHYESLDLAEYLRAPGAEEKRGVFLLTVQGYDPVQEAKKAKCEAKKKRPLGAPPADPDEYVEEEDEDCRALSEEPEDEEGTETLKDSRMILVTDLGILVKEWVDGTQEVFVQSIYTGQPVAGAQVEILGKNGVSLFSQVTDSEGRARFAKIENLSREHKPTLILVQKGNDLSFMPISLTKDGLDLSRFDVGGQRNAQVPDQVSAYLFSDRGIYRPGDTFHLGMIVKPARWDTNIVGLPLLVEALDSRGLTILSEKLKVPAGGFLEMTHALEESAPEGTYDINLYLVKDDKAGAQVGSAQIKVQEFLPDRMKVTAKLSAEASEGWISPEGLKALVWAQNLFGTPAENRRVTGQMSLNPAFPQFPNYSDYEFYDPHRAKEGYTEDLGETNTDAQGNAEFDLRLGKYAKATYRLSFLAEVFEPEGGRSVAASTTALVSDLPYLIGFKADGGLDYVSRGSKRNVSLIAIDPKLQKTAVSALTLQRIETVYVSVLNKQEDGTYRYESRKKEVKGPESPLEIPAAGYVLELDTANPGDFAYTVRDAQGNEVNRIQYSVAGQGNVTRSLERNAELKLALNRKQYSPGEEIEVSIRAPYVGAGLISIERDKVYAVQWFKSETLASVQKIRVPPDFEGNGYVSVQFIRDPSSDEIFMSPLSYGVAPFSGTLSGVTNPLKLTAPERMKPGEALNIQLQAEQPTKAVVFAVDEGILQVAAYKLPNPLGFFFQKKMLEVRTSQILDMILPEFKKLLLTSAAGGDGEEGLEKYLNPFKRKRDKPVVFWSGIVDVNGNREFSYPVPDYFNGSIRVMAVAVNETRIGTAQTQSLVRGDLVISPNAPTTVTPGDEFEVSVGISNNVEGSGKEAPISLTLKTPPSLEIVGNPIQTLKVDEGREGVSVFRVKVAEGDAAKLGSTTLNFVAALDKKSAEFSVDVSVRPATPRYTQLQMGSFSDRSDISVLRDLYPEYRQLEAGVSLLPLVLASGLSQYLADYEHLCTEQLVSQAMSVLVLNHRPEFGEENTPGPRSLEDTFGILRTRQNADGGFGTWVASVQPDEFASVYAVQLMLEAQERGETVPPDMLQKGLDYLQKYAATPAQELWELRDRAYAAYLLTRHAVVTTPILTSLREALESRFPKEWKSDLAGIYLASSYQLLKQQAAADQLFEEGFGKWMPQGTTAFEYGHYYDPLIRDSQLLYLMARHFPEKVKALPATAMASLVKPIADGRFNTLSASYLILAFDAYANQISAADQGKLGIAELDANGTEKALALPVNAIPRVPFSPQAKQLRMSNSSGLTAYYAVSESGFDRKLPTSELRQGMEIQKEYLDAAGKPVTSLVTGEEITVRIRYRTVDHKAISDGALIDLLPGGFEPVMNLGRENQGGSELGGLSGAHANGGIQFAEAREDRVIFYGTIPQDMGELSYRIKATNAGRFLVPPAYAESMYERGVQARSIGGQTLTVTPAARAP